MLIDINADWDEGETLKVEDFENGKYPIPIGGRCREMGDVLFDELKDEG